MLPPDNPPAFFNYAKSENLRISKFHFNKRDSGSPSIMHELPVNFCHIEACLSGLLFVLQRKGISSSLPTSFPRRVKWKGQIQKVGYFSTLQLKINFWIRWIIDFLNIIFSESVAFALTLLSLPPQRGRAFRGGRKLKRINPNRFRHNHIFHSSIDWSFQSSKDETRHK